MATLFFDMDINNLDDLEVELPPEFGGLPVFVVGGAVRDAIRGVQTKDIDLMVAEVTPDEMRERGFKEIDNANNDTFAVFLDSLGREVALARQERSTGSGHKDFDVTPVPASVEASEAVERDLKRRDFTVNAMALDARWNVLHDPHAGVRDLRNGIIRAVDSDAFRQDPLRIVRGARFAARLNSRVEEATGLLMQEMVEGLDSLPSERIRMELEKVLVQAEEPSRFFEVLDNVGALEHTFPELAALKDVPAGPAEFHEEGDSFDHTMLVLDEMAHLRPNDELGMLMALAHDLGKARTDEDDLPSHPEHGKFGPLIAQKMATRLSMSNEQRDAMREACRFHMRFHNVEDLRASTVVEMWQEMDNFYRLWDLALADSKGRIPEGEPPEGYDRFVAARKACNEWTGQRLIDEGYDPEEMGGENFGNLLHQKRVEFMHSL